jgi:hypothetical protein
MAEADEPEIGTVPSSSSGEHRPLNVDAIEVRYANARHRFERVKARYSGFCSKFRKKMRERDKAILSKLLEGMILLRTEPAITSGQTSKVQDQDLMEFKGEIINYLARFKNTGFTRC